MPKLMTDNMDLTKLPGGGGFQFSHIRPENLGATEYTLVSIVCDITGSVNGFQDDLLKCVKTVVDACKKSPRAENLLIRFTIFNNIVGISEIHGFKLLSMIDPNDYKPFKPNGMTNLFDASYESIGATLAYSKNLMDQDFNVNGAVYIITDGVDNNSQFNFYSIKKQVEDSKKSEIIESLITILIGVNTQDCSQYLANFKNEADLTQYVDSGDATPQRLAKLAAFVSKSISSQSQALGTGAQSGPISATF
jgi:hypothetical protein